MLDHVPQLGLIGAGAMGSAILRGAIRAGVIDPARVLVIEPNDARRQAMAELGCTVSTDPSRAHTAGALVLCVKPQMFPDLAKAIGPLPQATVVISVMAGLGSSTIRAALGTNARVVRTMPNTPGQIGKGISAIALGDGAQPVDGALARTLLGAIGDVVDVEESAMHAVTAVSGSGPAYVFLLAESMKQAGIQLGLDPHVARQLAYTTVMGAGQLLATDPDSDSQALRKHVTSPGGTTAAALEEMFKRELPQIVVDAIRAARDRGIELDQAPTSRDSEGAEPRARSETDRGEGC